MHEEHPYVLVSFGPPGDTWRLNVLFDVSSLEEVEKAACLVPQTLAWPNRYIVQNGTVAKSLTGPDLDGCSLSFAIDYFSKTQPVTESPTQGDANILVPCQQ